LRNWRLETSVEIADRAETFRKVLASLPEWRIDQIGAYFAYVRHPFAGVEAAAVAELLARECGLLALPGSYFGPGQDQHLRLAFANVGRSTIEKIPDRLAAFPQTAFGNDFERKDHRHG
jgi:aspartate/methionine/tyrosine aminotransferase